MPEQKQMLVQKCRELFTIHTEGSDGFPARLTTGDEPWFYCPDFYKLKQFVLIYVNYVP
jgi:hypothetical protein